MSATRWLEPTEKLAWRGLLRATRALFDQLGHELIEEFGLSMTDYEILVRLSEESYRRMRMSDLAAATGLSKSRLSHQMTRLEERGLTQREHCDTDARGLFGVLTDDGFDLLERAAREHVRGVRAHFFDHLTRDQVDSLATWSGAVVAHLDPEGRGGPVLPEAAQR